MKTFAFSRNLLLIAAFASFFACTPEPTEKPTVKTSAPVVPDASRIIIHFGTSTQRGCMYSFSNCIWIGWGASAENYAGKLALRFDDAAAAGAYFGNYYPLTADYTVTQDEAHALGIEPQTLPSGWYPLEQTPDGAIVRFSVENYQPLPALINPNNPQDNLGQLHNLAMQVLLSPENLAEVDRLGDDKKAVKAFIIDQTIAFLEEAGIPASSDDQQIARGIDYEADFSDYEARMAETHLSANDQNVLRAVKDEISGMPVNNLKDLGKFVARMTEIENELAAGNTRIDDPRMVLSALSVMKCSRYYWYWKTVSAGNGGTPPASSIPDWVWADIIGMELGGPVGSIAASALVYLDKR